MQREIKFRAWLKCEEKMCNVEKLWFPLRPFPMCSVITDKDRGFGSEEVELMQYTGLKDKNGVEIYEGDVVKAEDGEVFVVKYGEHATSEWNDNYEIGFYVESTSEEEIGKGIRTDIIFWVKHRALQIIGNIYENQELLSK